MFSENLLALTVSVSVEVLSDSTTLRLNTETHLDSGQTDNKPSLIRLLFLFYVVPGDH